MKAKKRLNIFPEKTFYLTCPSALSVSTVARSPSLSSLAIPLHLPAIPSPSASPICRSLPLRSSLSIALWSRTKAEAEGGWRRTERGAWKGTEGANGPGGGRLSVFQFGETKHIHTYIDTYRSCLNSKQAVGMMTHPRTCPPRIGAPCLPPRPPPA